MMIERQEKLRFILDENVIINSFLTKEKAILSKSAILISQMIIVCDKYPTNNALYKKLWKHIRAKAKIAKDRGEHVNDMFFKILVAKFMTNTDKIDFRYIEILKNPRTCPIPSILDEDEYLIKIAYTMRYPVITDDAELKEYINSCEDMRNKGVTAYSPEEALQKFYDFKLRKDKSF